MINIWNSLLFYPLINALMFLHQLTGSLGWAIIVLTVALRFLMTPLVLPGLRLSKKMTELAPEVAKLKEKYKDDKTTLATAQAELYKSHGANPASGCLPQILQIVILITLFNALNLVLKSNGDLPSRLNAILYSFNRLPSNFNLSTRFFYLDLSQPDVFRLPNIPLPLPGVFLLFSALVQFITSKMMSPVITAEQKLAQKTATDTDDTAVAMQQQMLYMFPVMTLIFGYQFSSGLVLYWLVFSLVGLVQQYQVTAWGGLTPWIIRLRLIKS